jgi:hypothetical protein
MLHFGALLHSPRRSTGQFRRKFPQKKKGNELLAVGKIPGLLRKHRSRSVRETFTRMLCDCSIAAVQRQYSTVQCQAFTHALLTHYLRRFLRISACGSAEFWASEGRSNARVFASNVKHSAKLSRRLYLARLATTCTVRSLSENRPKIGDIENRSVNISQEMNVGNGYF